jgi:hypothetical protein
MYEPWLPLDTELTVLDGPVSASGYTWYKVAPVSFAGLSGPGYGWVAAAGKDREAWIALAGAPATGPTLHSPTPSVTARGWPVARAGDPVFGPDGTVYAVVRTPDETPFAIVALDAGGHLKPGWPIRLPAPESSVGLAAGRDGSLYATICQRSPAECRLHRFTADGGEPRGWPFLLGGMAGCSAPLVGPDGTVYATCHTRSDGADPSTGLTGADPSKGVTIAADPVSGARAGWPVHYGGDTLAIGPDGTLYVNAWQSYRAGDAPMTVAAFAPDGTLRPGWPLSWPADAFVRLAPDGTLFAWWYEDLQGMEGGFTAKRTFYATIGADGRTLPGWPTSTIGAASSPAIGADGTLYYDTLSGDVYARDGKGAVKSGWPVRGVGGSDLAVSPPYVSPDGSILALDRSGATWLSPGGRALAAWGPGRSGSLSYCTGGATGCAGRVSAAPVFAPDGTVYVLVWVADAESGNLDTEIAALDRHGDVKSGWPRPALGLVFAGLEGAWLRVGPDGRVYIVGNQGVYALMPDGTLAK